MIDIVLQGPASDVHLAHTRLTDQLAKIGLQVQPGKSCAYSEHQAGAQKLATDLGVKVAAGGLVVAGCPVGQSTFVQEQVTAAVDSVVAQISDFKVSQK